MRRSGIALAALTFAGVGACSSGAPHPGPAAPTSAAAPTVSAHPRPSSVAGLTGLGAQLSAYDAAHRGDTSFGSAASVDGKTVVAYVVTFTATVSMQAALATLLPDLPTDVVQVADVHPSSACEQLWFTSAVLHAALEPSAYAVVSFTSPPLTSYSAQQVQHAYVDTDAVGGPGSLACPTA